MLRNLGPVRTDRICSNLAVVKSSFTLLVCGDKAVLAHLPDDTGVNEVVEDLRGFIVGLLLNQLLVSLSNPCLELINPS